MHACTYNCNLHRYNIIDILSVYVDKLETPTIMFSCIKCARARDEFLIMTGIFVISTLLINTRVLLWGDPSLTDEDSEYFFSLVHMEAYIDT